MILAVLLLTRSFAGTGALKVVAIGNSAFSAGLYCQYSWLLEASWAYGLSCPTLRHYRSARRPRSHKSEALVPSAIAMPLVQLEPLQCAGANPGMLPTLTRMVMVSRVSGRGGTGFDSKAEAERTSGLRLLEPFHSTGVEVPEPFPSG